MEIVKVKEAVQCGDNWLLKFTCPLCRRQQFEGYPLSNCSGCSRSLKDFPVDLSNCHKRLLAGTYRKPKGGLSKKKVQELLESQNKKCAYCYKDLNTTYHVEHILPLVVGGLMPLII